MSKTTRQDSLRITGSREMNLTQGIWFICYAVLVLECWSVQFVSGNFWTPLQEGSVTVQYMLWKLIWLFPHYWQDFGKDAHEHNKHVSRQWYMITWLVTAYYCCWKTHHMNAFNRHINYGVDWVFQVIQLNPVLQNKLRCLHSCLSSFTWRLEIS